MLTICTEGERRHTRKVFEKHQSTQDQKKRRGYGKKTSMDIDFESPDITITRELMIIKSVPQSCSSAEERFSGFIHRFDVNFQSILVTLCRKRDKIEVLRGEMLEVRN